MSLSSFQFAGSFTALCGLHLCFSASCASSCSFAFGAPPVVFRAAGSQLVVPRLSGCGFLFVSARFLSPGFPPCCVYHCLFLGLHFLPWCLLLLVLVCGVLHSGFGSSSAGSALLYLVWHYGSLMFSDSFESPVPIATWSPFGMSQGCYGLCFSWFQDTCMCWCPFCFFCFFLSPLRSSALSASGVLLVSCCPVGCVWFPLVLCLVRFMVPSCDVSCSSLLV